MIVVKIVYRQIILLDHHHLVVAGSNFQLGDFKRILQIQCEAVASSGILIDDPPGTPPPYVAPMKPVKSVGVLSYSSKAGSSKTGMTGGHHEEVVPQSLMQLIHRC